LFEEGRSLVVGFGNNFLEWVSGDSLSIQGKIGEGWISEKKACKFGGGGTVGGKVYDT